MMTTHQTENTTAGTAGNAAGSAAPLSRRKFMFAGALAGAGLVLAPRSLNAQNANVPSTEKKADSVLNIAVVGCGEQGNALLNSINGIKNNKSPSDRIYKKDYRLVALADVWPWQLKKNVSRQKSSEGWPELQGFGSIEELLAAKDKLGLDAVFIATPDHWHCRHTVLALNAGLPTYCEKMMARNAAEGREMVLASRHRPDHKDDASKPLLQIGHQRRSNPNYRFAYDILLRRYQFLGRITNANGQWNRAISQSQDITLSRPAAKTITDAVLKASEFFEGDAANPFARAGKKFDRETALHRFRNWRWFKAYSNGPISDLGAHQIDIFNWVFGRPRSVIAAGGSDYFHSGAEGNRIFGDGSAGKFGGVLSPKGTTYPGREWYDNVMCIFDYVGDGSHPGLPLGEVARAYYQVLTTTSSGGGYFENFMGELGSLKIAENEAIIKSYSEKDDQAKKMFTELIAKGALTKDVAPPAPKKKTKAVLDSRTSAAPDAFNLTSALTKLPHQPHVENFLRVVRDNKDNDPKKGETLNCDGLHAFQSESPIFRINEAVEAQKRLFYTDDDFSLTPKTGA